MLRRSILRLSLCRSDRRIPIQITSQIPSYLSSRKAFSTASEQNDTQGPGSTGKSPESEIPTLKLFVGGVAIGAAGVAAYQTGYLDKFLGKKPHGTNESTKTGAVNKDQQDLPEGGRSSENSEHLVEPIADLRSDETSISTLNVKPAEENILADSVPSGQEDLSRREEEVEFQVEDVQEPRSEGVNQVQGIHLSTLESTTQSDDSSSNLSKPSEESFDMKSPEVRLATEQQKEVEVAPLITQDNTAAAENEMDSIPIPQITTQGSTKDDLINATGESSPLLDEYFLKNNGEEPASNLTQKSQDSLGISEEGDTFKDGKLVLDFLQAIHAAERRQAELDAHTFAEEKRMMKEKYEKELRDARARELMYAEREAILDKELNKEKVKAAAALKLLQEKLEEKHRIELESKEKEAERKLKKVQELAKAELASAIASEKASQIEKMSEANLHINALCMAFYARSEEARQSHSIHKLALGALALEDALSRGLPIQKEIEALHIYLEGIDKGSLLDLVLSSLPEETRVNGTDTLLQLNHKFNALKGTLRHFSLIPPGGGGILAHSLAHVASWLKVREVDQSGDGIESLMNRVESFLAQGKLIEAADALENGVKGTQAAQAVENWIRRARNRAVTEQALTLLESYATSISLT